MFHTPIPFTRRTRRTPRVFSGVLTPATANPFQSPSVPSQSSNRPANNHVDSWASEDQAAVSPVPHRVLSCSWKFWVSIMMIELSLISSVMATAVLFVELGTVDNAVTNGAALTLAWLVVSFAVCFISMLVCCIVYGRTRHGEGNRSGAAESIALKRFNRVTHGIAAGVQTGQNSGDENRRRSESMQRQLTDLEDQLQRRNHRNVRTGLTVPDEGDMGIYSLNEPAPASARCYPLSMQSNGNATAARSSFNSSVDSRTAVTNYSPLDDMLSSERIRNMSHRSSRAYFEMRRERQALPNGVHVAGQGTVRAEPSARRFVDPARFELSDDFEVDDEQTDGHLGKTAAGEGEVRGGSAL